MRANKMRPALHRSGTFSTTKPYLIYLIAQRFVTFHNKFNHFTYILEGILPLF